MEWWSKKIMGHSLLQEKWGLTRNKHIWTQKARIQGWFDPYAGREADWWQSPDLLWGQLNPDRLLYNLYEELEQGQRLVKELEGQK